MRTNDRRFADPPWSDARCTRATYMPPKLPSPLTASPLTPLARGQIDDAPAALRIPSPSELGISNRASAISDDPIDWKMLEKRLDAAVGSSFQIEKTADGFRFVCQLPSGAIAARGATKAEAVRQGLSQLRP